MAGLSKRKKLARERVEAGRLYGIEEALSLVKELASAKFTESVDVAVNLGVDPRKSDQVVRGSTVLPNGTGKTVRVAVFAQGENADKAVAAGADIVGFEDLAEQIQKGELGFDVVIATPDAMRVVGKLGQILGPRGLMPNRGGHGHAGRRDSGDEREGRAGQITHRQGRHHSLPDR